MKLVRIRTQEEVENEGQETLNEEGKEENDNNQEDKDNGSPIHEVHEYFKFPSASSVLELEPSMGDKVSTLLIPSIRLI